MLDAYHESNLVRFPNFSHIFGAELSQVILKRARHEVRPATPIPKFASWSSLGEH